MAASAIAIAGIFLPAYMRLGSLIVNMPLTVTVCLDFKGLTNECLTILP